MENIQQIIQDLNLLPSQIRDQELLYVEAEKKLEEAKLKYDVSFGMAIASSKKPNATEKKSEALIIAEEQANDLIEAKYNLKKEQAGLNFLNNRFVAVRKISSIEERMMQSQLSGF